MVRPIDKLRSVAEALSAAARLNAAMLAAKAAGRATLVIQVGSASQLMHVEPVLETLLARPSADRVALWVLTSPEEAVAVRTRLARLSPAIAVDSHRAARLLVACDFMLALDQGSMFPWFGCRTNACSFHGQPSKGNVYQRFNHRQIDTLFLYGPLMRDYYLRTKAENPQWPDITLLEVGQPLTDRRFNVRTDRREARARLGLDPARFTVLYAPSFEYCSSLATDGAAIIDALAAEDVNLIVKPHPAFYNSAPFDDEFNRDSPRAPDWRERIADWSANGRCLFPAANTLDGDLALAAADVMLTDYSGIAFDGITLDLGMIFWECPRFWDDYLPRRYGADGTAAKADLACNVGRDAGIVVADTAALVRAIAAYRDDPSRLGEARRQVRQQLYFNLGRAAGAMTDAIENRLFGAKHDQQRTEHRLLG